MSDLTAWLNKQLESIQNTNEVAKSVQKTLEEQCCTDLETLKDCWPEIKDALPGVPRKLIGDALASEEQDKMKFEPKLDPWNWFRAAVGALIAIVLPILLSAFKDRDGSPEVIVADQVYECWVPLIVLFLIEIVACSKLGPRIGYDMIQERSVDVSLREAMRNNMANQAIIGTLVLAVMWEMSHADPSLTDEGQVTFSSQWYEGLSLISTGQLFISVMTACFNLLYVEPLDDLASLKFVGDNFSYFGEPLALMLVALYNAMIGIIIWVFATYGFGQGIVCTCVMFYVTLRTSVVYLYLGQWENVYLSDEEKTRREQVAKKMVTAGGEIGSHKNKNHAQVEQE